LRDYTAAVVGLRPATVALVGVLVLVGCSSNPWPGRSFRPLNSGEVPVRTLEPANVLCAGGGFDAVLRGAPGNPAETWITYDVDGRREEVVWPPGYSARFEPALLVFDESGTLIAREGSQVLGGCPMPGGGFLVDLPSSRRGP
jgi:hypothetical protein